MCIAPGSRMFVRGDSVPFLGGEENHRVTLPLIKATPAGHMNYTGGLGYTNSGFLSLFEYVASARPVPSGSGRGVTHPVIRALNALRPSYLHFLFVPPSVQVVYLDESNVRDRVSTGRKPTLFDTSACTPPAKLNENREVIEYADRYIPEFLYSGEWARGLRVITEQSRFSRIWDQMASRTPVDAISEYCDGMWPCNPNYFPDRDEDASGPGGSIGRGFAV